MGSARCLLRQIKAVFLAICASFHPSISTIIHDHSVKQRMTSSLIVQTSFCVIELDTQLDFLDYGEVNFLDNLGTAPGAGLFRRVWGTGLTRTTTFTVYPSPSTTHTKVCRGFTSCGYEPLNIEEIEEELARSESNGHGTVTIDLVSTLPQNGWITDLLESKYQPSIFRS
ncbi:hypothetical protein EDD85DRAFT_962292 [Armillaria nabsnona]|nr:hypothetical protein EDD85DRAFT_962292 [Armillaria nabsnona]